MNLTLQKRLMTSIMKCGKRRVWLDPQQMKVINVSKTRENIRRLIATSAVLVKPVVSHCRSRTRVYRAARKLGRHRGLGKRSGTANARCPEKEIWIKRIRALRRTLKDFRRTKKIDSHLYRKFYRKAKGNCFKNRRLMIEAILKHQQDQQRMASIVPQIKAVKGARAAASVRLVEGVAAISAGLGAGSQRALTGAQ